MQSDFQRIAVLGGGLLGGSIALAAQALPTAPDIRLWARRPETAARARELGIHRAHDALGRSVAGADLCILCVPVGAMPGLLAAAIDAGLPGACTVTDVGSVKSTPHRDLDPLMLGREGRFIGSHPMAGSERKGIEAARPGLMENAACILTNDGGAPPSAAARLEAFWRSLGCRTSWMDASAHDALVARISHLPHVIAASAARVALCQPEKGAYGGGGLRDTTRVAGGDPAMWAEILTENRAALLDPVRETLADLTEILALLEAGDQEAVRKWLGHAAKLRAAARIAD